MKLKTLFEKEVDRTIEGVIKADDEASLRLEFEEYVLTAEVEKRLESFLDAYNNYEGANGVWISGFFGSGKSHLLKILALLLENRQIEGVPVLDIFLPKCGDNEILRGDLKRAVGIPSKSILFNIDQKADVISKTQVDALMAVFVKVFDEMCGYYGRQAYIAEFERDLDRDGLLGEFKKEFQARANREWEWGRSRPNRVASDVDEAFNAVTGQKRTDVLDKYRQDYRLSIEDFAEQVNEYIEKQSPDFRLNFFVDEVGQYISENIKLMTNLQTIAESLATKCRGRAWVIVTAQEDMGTVVGEMGKQQGNDFSKIQARFANRMKLTSADVAEVIQKRLLMKNEQGVSILSDIYHDQANNFKTLFDFADGSQTYKNYRDREHFIHSYPFIPYQFALFQAAITNLSEHNAFEGKHSSVGERSMLGVFQQVAIQICSHETGKLATFDLMFEGIRTALKSNIQRSIIQAENHLESIFAIRLLKALFLVKYVKEFKPTQRNLCVLMHEGFQQDLPELRKKVEEALDLLEQQTYVQRNGELYEFLTDEEKDVEQEIKGTDVESTEVAAELQKLIFDSTLKLNKIRYSENGQDYAFSKKLDDRLFGREHELSLHVISPFHEHAENEQMLVVNSSYKMDELFVILPPDNLVVRELLMYKRTEKYIRQNISITQVEAVKRILNDKGYQNNERLAELRQRVRQALGKAKLLVAGSEVEVGTEDAQSRIVQGFHELIARSYPNLRMLRGISYSENDISKILKSSQQSLFGSDSMAMSEAEQEMFAVIQSNKREGVRTTPKQLMEKFERKPYGWYYAAILCILAKLIARGKVEAKNDANLLEENELERALRNSHGHGNIILVPQVEFTASQVRGLKELYGELFDKSPRGGEAKALGKETAEAVQELMQQLQPLIDQVSRYPFLKALDPVFDTFKEHTGKPYTWYLEEFIHQEDTLLDMKEDLLDPIRKFMHGPQRDIYDSARKFLEQQKENLSYLDEGNGSGGLQTRETSDDELSRSPEYLAKVLADPQCYKGQKIQQVKSVVKELEEKVDKQVEAARAEACAKVNRLQQRLTSMAEFSKLSQEQQNELTAPFAECVANISTQRLIAVIYESLRRFEETTYQRQLSKLTSWAQPPPPPDPEPGETNGNDQEKNDTPPKQKPRVEIVSSKSLDVSFAKPLLADEKDVDDYLQSMRQVLLEQIRNGKRIQI